MRDFKVIGEKIHCTRSLKVGGEFAPADEPVIFYSVAEERRRLPISEVDLAAWKAGKVKPCAVAIWQGMHGSGQAQSAGLDYLRALALSQEKDGAHFLDLNVDEYGRNVAERVEAMRWLVATIQGASDLPLSIDSSSVEIIQAGLSSCRRPAMLNSVSLERLAAIPLAGQYHASVVASAAGVESLPDEKEGRLRNLNNLLPRLEAVGIPRRDIYIDPLVFPIATAGHNGRSFFESVTAIREAYGEEIHITAGCSNISFGMPNRKLINQVFACLAVEAGADSGIVDPAQINGRILQELDRQSEAFKLAYALLQGEDEYGMEFIMASREGRI